MRSITFQITCVLLCSAAIAHVQAQEESVHTATSALFAPKHIIKTNLVAYAFYSITGNYETKTGAATSVGLLGGYKLPQTITVNGIAELSEGNQTYTGEIDPEGFFVNPYFRFYGRETFKGFYFEGFLRYYDFKFKVPYDYDKNGQTIKAFANGTSKAWGGGLGFGSQFNLAPHWYIDINAGFGLANGDIRAETSDPNLDAQDYADIKDNIEANRDAEVDIFLLGGLLDEMEADANANSAWVEFNDVIIPIVRGGVSIGFAF